MTTLLLSLLLTAEPLTDTETLPEDFVLELMKGDLKVFKTKARSVDVGDPAVVSAKISAGKLTLKALAAGHATLSLKPAKGDPRTFEVNVAAPTDAYGRTDTASPLVVSSVKLKRGAVVTLKIEGVSSATAGATAGASVPQPGSLELTGKSPGTSNVSIETTQGATTLEVTVTP